MKEIPFRIRKIENEPIEIFPDLVNKDIRDFVVDSGFAYNGDINDCWIGCQADFTFKQGNTVVAKLVATCFFEIDPNFVNREIKDGKLTIDKEFIRYISTITVGTARGIFHAKTQNTILNQFVLPPINLTAINMQDMILS